MGEGVVTGYVYKSGSESHVRVCLPVGIFLRF